MKPDHDLRLRHVVALHFDPAGGSRYWLERERELGLDARAELRTLADLAKLGAMPLEDLAARPVSDFVPQKFLRAGRRLVLAETGGATGAPKATAYFEDEFQSVFVDSFVRTAEANGFSGSGAWLWIGPGGPHVIGRAAFAIASRLSGAEPFAVDFDPRWYRRLEPGSIARTRYLDHLLEQSLRVAARERVENLFATPVVLRSLAARLDGRSRERVRGVYLGGMAIEPEALREIGAAFPNARMLAGYGNTLFGVCHAPGDLRGASEIRYYPQADRLAVRVVREEEDGAEAAYGERGRVMFHRLDESSFLPNVLERDGARRVEGEFCDGVADPSPLERKAFAVDAGIY